MKILIANSTSNVIGGAEIAIAETLLSVIDHIDVTFFVTKEGGLSQFYRDKGFKVVIKYVSNPRRKFPGLHTITSLGMANYLKKEKFDFVLCNTLPAIYKMKTACKLSKISMGVYLRDHPNYPQKYSNILNQCAFVASVSHELKDYFQPYTKHNIVVIRDWIDLNYIQEQSKKTTSFSLKGSPRIAQIGRIQSIKQQDIFIKSVRDILSVFTDARFFIVGEAANNSRDQEYLTMLKSLVEELELQEKVVFTGFVKDIESFIANVDIVVLPSKHEAFPRTILECQAIGTPIIASNQGGGVEMIKNGVNGFLFDPSHDNSFETLAKIVNNILLDNELRQNIIFEGKQHIYKNYTENDPRKILLNELEKLK